MKPIYIGLKNNKFGAVSQNESLVGMTDYDQIIKLDVFELEMIVGLFMSQDKGIKLHKTGKNHWSDYTFVNKSHI